MIKISKEEFATRYDALPESLREKLLADENINMLWTIGEVHHLSEERVRKLAGVVGYVVLGLIHLEDLAKEIAIETGVDRRLADELAREIQVKILAPVIPEIQRIYHYGSTDSPQAGSTGSPQAGAATSPEVTPQAASAVPAQPEVLRPAFAPPPQDQPFVLHEEREEIERVRPRDKELMRPSFYNPPTGSGQEESDLRQGFGGQSTAARLEIGPSMDSAHSTSSRQASPKEPQVGKTEEPPIKVVHYSGPQTPVDPFSPSASLEQERPMEAPRPPKEVHPENIIDLKDLPK